MATLQMESKHAAPDLKLSQTRVIRAPRERVYEAWIDADLLKAWLPPGNMAVPAIAVDARHGGQYHISMQGTLDVHNGVATADPSGPIAVAEGTYLEVVPGRRIVYTWKGSWNPAEETQVTVTFADHANGTEVTVNHDGFQSEQSLETHRSGWKSSLEKLSRLFEKIQ